MSVAVIGYSMTCAQGTQAEEVVRRLDAPLPPSGRALDFLGKRLALPYFAAFDEEKLSLDALCDLLERHALDALAASGYAPDALRQMPLFFASTSFHIADYERRADDEGLETAQMQYALHRVADYFLQKYGNEQVFTCATSCTSAANALIYAKNFMDCSWCEHALVLAFESFNALTLSNFQALGLLRQDAAASAGSGMVLGEGVAAVVLAKNPSEPRPCTLIGMAAMTDPDGMTSISEEVLCRTLHAALDDAQLSAADVCAVKANAPGGDNDVAEKGAFARLFPAAPVVSFKPFIGNTLGASALMEWVLMMMCLQQGVLPGTVPVRAGYYLLPTFGFGGNSCALLMRYTP